MALNKNKNLKLYYSIGEVASMFGVTETLLRFWEKEFPSIKPQKAGRGIRQYTRDDIDVIRKIHYYVKEKGMTLEGARQALKENREGTDVKIEVLDRLKSIRDELQEISKEMNYLS
ncbi:MAG: MerR family transcriptional regulator [Bacteroidaceae bacterium]|nr:MerR family transcriptional regulator [Bacteroidaceae bacterium]